jgi:hypothetical protein
LLKARAKRSRNQCPLQQGWAPNFKNVAPQKQNAKFEKPRAWCAKRDCAFKLFKAPCAATIKAKNASFHKKNSFKRKEQIRNFFI